MNEDIRNIKNKAEDNRYVPTVNSTLRAAISAIPWIGGSLDHLLFDKSEEIRQRKIENSIKKISERLNELNETNLNKDWFNSPEAIEMFKQLIDKIQFEQDEIKSSTLSKIYAISGTKEFADDPNKFAVLNKVSELTTIQKKLLLIIDRVNPVERHFTKSALHSTATSIWGDDIVNAVNNNPEGQFWKATTKLDVELEIIESLNLIRKINNPLANIVGYEITGLGKLVLNYLHKAS